MSYALRRLEYLRAQGEQFGEHVAFMSEFPRMRPSNAKKEWLVQVIRVCCDYRTHSTRDGVHVDGRWLYI